MNAKRVIADPSSAVPQDVLGILETVIEERDRAMQKWGVQTHPDGTGGGAAAILRDQQRDLVDQQKKEGKSNWRDILMEEVREAFAETDLVALDNELMQVMQVCCVWREDIHRRISTMLGEIPEEALLENERRDHDAKVSEAISEQAEQKRAIDAARVGSTEEGARPF